MQLHDKGQLTKFYLETCSTAILRCTAGVGMHFPFTQGTRHAFRSQRKLYHSVVILALPLLIYYRNTQRRIYLSEVGYRHSSWESVHPQFTCLSSVLRQQGQTGLTGTTRTVAVVLQTQRGAVSLCTGIARITHREKRTVFSSQEVISNLILH